MLRLRILAGEDTYHKMYTPEEQREATRLNNQRYRAAKREAGNSGKEIEEVEDVKPGSCGHARGAESEKEERD
jgi:hypothetical protein